MSLLTHNLKQLKDMDQSVCLLLSLDTDLELGVKISN